MENMPISVQHAVHEGKITSSHGVTESLRLASVSAVQQSTCEESKHARLVCNLRNEIDSILTAYAGSVGGGWRPLRRLR